MIIHFCSIKQSRQYRVNWQHNQDRHSIIVTNILDLLKVSTKIGTLIIHEHPSLLKFILLYTMLLRKGFRGFKIIFDIHDALDVNRYSWRKYPKYVLYVISEFIYTKHVKDAIVFVVSDDQRKLLNKYYDRVQITTVDNFGGLECDELSEVCNLNARNLKNLKYCYFGYIDERKIDYTFYENFAKDYSVELFGDYRGQVPSTIVALRKGDFTTTNFKQLLRNYDILVFVPGHATLSIIDTYLNVKLLMALSLGKCVLVVPEMVSFLRLFDFEMTRVGERDLCLIKPSEANYAKIVHLSVVTKNKYREIVHD